MGKPIIALCLLLQWNLHLWGQDLSTPVQNAYLIAQIAEKYHVEPRPLDANFSRGVFSQLINQLDPNKIIFTEKDLQDLRQAGDSIAHDIQNRQSSFLSLLISRTQQGLATSDSLIHLISQEHFTFNDSGPDNTGEADVYAADLPGLKARIRWLLRESVLKHILDQDSVEDLPLSRLGKYVDSVEPSLRTEAAYRLIQDDQIRIEGIHGTAEELGRLYCKAIASVFDPHTEYFPVSEKENFDAQLGKSPMVFGFRFRVNSRGWVQIEEIAPGSPAFKCGQFNKGDRILSVQWASRPPIDVSQAGLSRLYEVLSLSNHEKATFRIQKPDGTTRIVSLYKERADEANEQRVKSFVLKGAKTIGFISLPAFYQDGENPQEDINGCANDVAREILKLKKDHIQGLVLDLRFNGGGSVQEAVELAGLFIDAGPVTEFKSRSGKVFTLKDVNRGTMYDGPLVILVNGYTASASEIVAAALQDYHRALIMGSPTYGKATAQIVLPLDTSLIQSPQRPTGYQGDFLKLTISQWFRVSGQTIQAKGVQPDILLPDITASLPKQEADEPFALKIQPVSPDKYFTPYPVIQMDTLKTLAARYKAESPYFSGLKAFNEKMSTGLSGSELPLNLAKAVALIKQERSFTEKAFGDTLSPYNVVNNSFDANAFPTGDPSAAIDDQWKKFLSRDPYLKVAFQVISAMNGEYD